ncbi:MAG TPA: glycosyltransferase family 4 protein [Steroidobacter sp.]
MTRVLLVGNDADYFLSHRLPLALRLSQEGYELHVALPFDPGDVRYRGLPFTLHRISLSRGSMRLHHEMKTLMELLSLYRRLRPDLVHHVTLKPTLYGGVAARLTGVPLVVNAMTGLGYVFTSDAIQARLIRAIAKWPLRFACRRENVTMIFQNPEDRDTFVSLGLTRKESTTLIRGSGVDVNIYRPAEEPPTGEPVVMLVSRMLWDKGIAEFVEAARMLKEEGATARFVLVGGTDPNPSSVPEATLKEWSSGGVVEWWGRQSDMPRIWAQAHIACLPSYAEGLPKSLLEAAAMGLPMVATDIPGCREIVRPGVTGLLVAKGDSRQLADALRQLIADPLRRRTLGGNARKLVETDFTVNKVVAETLELYEWLLSGMPDRAEERSAELS